MCSIGSALQPSAIRLSFRVIGVSECCHSHCGQCQCSRCSTRPTEVPAPDAAQSQLSKLKLPTVHLLELTRTDLNAISKMLNGRSIVDARQDHRASLLRSPMLFGHLVTALANRTTCMLQAVKRLIKMSKVVQSLDFAGLDKALGMRTTKADEHPFL